MRVLILASLLVTSVTAVGASSQWVHPNGNDKLVYKTTERGDRIMDFSHAGYMGGGIAIPQIQTSQTLKPSGTDDSERIQRALDGLAIQAPRNGFRGVLELAPGTFHCSNTINLSASGLILRGAGTNTVIELTGKPHNAITVRSSSTRSARAEPLAETLIADEYVPSGSMKFSVKDGSKFSIGDAIEIRRPITQSWIEFMGMHDLTRDDKPQTWLRVGNYTVHERRITATTNNSITIDVPVPDSFDAKLLNPPGTIVAKIKPPARLSQVGIENLRIVSPPQPFNHTQPHFTAIRMNAEDSWVRDVLIEETMNSVAVNGRRITLQSVTVNRNARHEGSSKPAEFAPNGTQVLMDRCSVTGDNIWFVGMGSGVSGPVVILNCAFNGDGRAESHQRWSTGVLYDNCKALAGGLDFRNRGSMGSGHGWTMGWGVAWNCEAKDYIIQNPPGAMNWMIGCIGENKAMPRPFGKEPVLPKGVEDFPGEHVTPQSLYLAQLKERLGERALKDIGY
jgi:hypothetical protein